MTPDCPLCGDAETSLFHEDQIRPYLRCRTCSFIHVPPAFYVSRVEEKAEYDLHQNDSSDEGYRRFLNRLCQPVCERVKPGSRGLDFGCGPGPLLARMFEEAGLEMTVYDPFYTPGEQVFQAEIGFFRGHNGYRDKTAGSITSGRYCTVFTEPRPCAKGHRMDGGVVRSQK